MENSFITDAVLFISRFMLIFGGALPYLPQYLQISASEDPSGFSTLVCFVLLVANAVRIVYWFGVHFETALLLQSIVMIFVMFVMLELCIRMQLRDAEKKGIVIRERNFLDFELRHFWAWTNLLSYIQAIVFITIIFGFIMFFFQHSPAIVEGIGYIALMTESMLAMPQLIKNWSSGSTQGLNILMVLMWAIGDGFKAVYSHLTKAPLPFLFCAVTQVTVDLTILAQILMY